MKSMKLKDMAVAAVFAAAICAVAPFTVPIGPVPLSLATLVIYLAAASAGWRTGTIAVLLYVLIGAAGMPVFSKFNGGLQHLVGVTGGFVVGYVPCALVTGLIVDRLEPRRWAYPAAMAAGTAVLYALGTAWFVHVTGSTLGAAVAACVAPFLVGDALKIALASAAAPVLRRALRFQKKSAES